MGVKSIQEQEAAEAVQQTVIPAVAQVLAADIYLYNASNGILSVGIPAAQKAVADAKVTSGFAEAMTPFDTKSDEIATARRALVGTAKEPKTPTAKQLGELALQSLENSRGRATTAKSWRADHKGHNQMIVDARADVRYLQRRARKVENTRNLLLGKDEVLDYAAAYAFKF